ncbi:hypothetical protein ACJMK2_017243 [Sinanodonta woodiana]|uniref:TIR domain-containing protein n=1 Tax=Sinanodonta woodiana TaxID=1069815 RepID=A0ABD3UXB3_SINWO
MDNKKKLLSRCLQLVYVVTFPVHPEDEQQFQTPESGPSDTKYSASQPVKLVSSYENDSSAPISFDKGSKGSESSDSDQFPIKGLSAEFSDTGKYGSHWILANEVLGRNQGEQQMFLGALSDSSQHATQQRQKYDQRAQTDSYTSSPQIGSYFGNHMQGSSVARDGGQFYDAVIVYDQSDFMEVQLFKEELTQMMTKAGYPGLRLELFDSTVFPASHIMSIEDIVRRSSLVLVYLTPQFNPNRLEFFCNEIIGLTRLGYNDQDVLAGGMESNQKWAFRPVHTQPERSRFYKIPIGLTTVIGMNWYDRYSENTRHKIISVMAQALQVRTQRENHAQFTNRYRELSKQHRNSEQGQPSAKESFLSSYNPSVPSQDIRPHYVNLYNTQNGTWMNSSHGVRTPVSPSFNQAPHIVRPSVPRAQVPYQSNGNVTQMVNMTRFQRPQLSIIPEQTLEQSGSFKSGQELHPHISTAPNYGMQHHNISQHSMSQASVDAFSIRSQDAYSIPFQHQLYTTRSQSSMPIAQSASLSAGQLNKTGWNGHYVGQDQVSDRNISYQQVPQNAGSNGMFHETMIGQTGQARPQMVRYTPDCVTSNQCVGQSDSKAFLKDTTAYQSARSQFNPMGVDVVNGVPFQTARIDSNIGNGVSQIERNVIVQSASLSSQAIPVVDHSQFIPQVMQRNAQTVLSLGNPQLSYQNMTSVVNPSIQGPQRSSFLIDSNSQPQIQDNFRQPLVSYSPSEYHERRSEQIHAYQTHANPSYTPTMQMNMHQIPYQN